MPAPISPATLTSRWRLLVATVASVIAVAALAASHAQAAATCKAPKYPGSGYFTSLKVTGTSCNQGIAVTKAHYACRVKNGKSGKCSAKVLGFACTEKRVSIPTEIDARVTCKKSKATVVYSYQQNL